MNKYFLLILLSAIVSTTYAAKVDTISVHSASMNKEVKTVVIRPDSYNKKETYPVLYLLHGYSGSYKDWVNKAPALKKLVDYYGYMVVCPDGGYGSWYWDSPLDPNYAYETFVAKELVSYIDNNFSTVATKAGRAITGLSMGGHGALSLAFKHQDIYGAVGSTSGGVDFRPFPKNWEIEKRIGSYAENEQLWDKLVVQNLVHLLVPKSLEIIIDCGNEDFFYNVNIALHEKFLNRNIKHTFVQMPGGHNWEYWQKSITYQLDFFAKFFSSRVLQK